MALRIRELDDLVLDRRAVSRTSAADRTTVQSGVLQMPSDDFPQGGGRPRQIAGHLLRGTRLGKMGEPVGAQVPNLPVHTVEIDCPAIYPGRSACLETF